ncbi:MAG: FHA domain-containing protein [Planctomycetes bacterium]|nr:FHA domain-containing protein [Planctomycetota bacterium]
MFELTIASKDGKVISRVELSGEKPVRIGRSPECEIQIPLPAISREHAQIEPVDDRHWVIRDLNSTHGCLVRGQRIRELTITPGLVVEVGPALLKFDEMATRIGAEMLASIKDDEEAPVKVRSSMLPDDTLR